MKNSHLIIIFTIFLFLVLIPTPILADQSTCQESIRASEDDNCDNPVKWDEIFSSIDMGDSSTLADEEYDTERLLFNQIRLMRNEEVENNLITNNIHTYEIHTTRSGENTINSGKERDVTYTKDDSNSATNYRSDNDFNPDNLILDAEIPENTSIIINIEDSDGNSLDNKVFYNKDRAENGEKSIYSAELNLSEKSSTYDVNVKLTRPEEDHDSPEISEGIVLEETAPIYRLDASPRDVYQLDTLDSFNEQMYDNYDDNIHESNYYKVMSPSYDEDKYESKIVNNAIYEGGVLDFGNEGEPIRDTYVNIDKVEPSVKVPTDDNGQKWDTKIGDEGKIYITYDSSVGEVPPDGKDYTSLSDGNKKWDFSHDDTQYTLELYTTNSYGVKEKIDEKTTSGSGVWEVEYDEDDMVSYISNIEVDMKRNITFEKSTDEAYDYEVDNPNGNGTITRCCRWNNNKYTNDYSFSQTVTDSMSVDGIASEDGPDDSDFDVTIGSFSDESRTHVDRKLENGIDSTRWTNMESKSIIKTGSSKINQDSGLKKTENTINFGRLYLMNDDKTKEPTLNEEIKNGINVYLDVWAHGNYTNNNKIRTYVEDNEINDGVSIDSGTREDRKQIIENKNITEYIGGESSIQLENEVEADFKDENYNPYITYAITIEFDEPVSQINSRYKYWTFRNSRWDNIEEIDKDCSSNCFDLIDKGISQSGAMPLQAHLLPSSQQIGGENTDQQIGYDIENVEYNDTKSNNTVNTPIKSPFCPLHPDYTDEDDNYERICSVYDGYLANDSLEKSYNEESLDIKNSEENNYIDSLKPDRSDPVLEYENQQNENMLSLDYRPLLKEEEYKFREESQFDIVSDSTVGSYQIAGNTSWTHNNISTEDIRIATDTKLYVNIIPNESLTENYVDRNEENVPSDNTLKTKEELGDNEVQVKIELKDENNIPIHTEKRDTGEQIIGTAFYGDEPEFEIIDSKLNTNESGIGYETMKIAEEENDIIYNDDNIFNDDKFKYDNSNDLEDMLGKYKRTEFQFKSNEKWWETPKNTRVLESSKSTIKIPQSNNKYDNQNDIENPTSTLFNIFISLIILFLSIFSVIALFMRVYPNSNITTMDLIYTATDPYRERILDTIQLIIIISLLSFILYLWANFI